jgi:ABC-2 type transport system ATP-binding protein
MSIEVNSLLKQYGSQTAVDRISFSVGKGEIVGFLGPNGAGKSTTMKMITGYLEPDGGDIRVCGIPVLESPLQTKARIGYLPEANPLYYDMYVREYLAFMAGIHQVKAAAERIGEVIRLTGLLPESHKKIGQLSKGYKQRVGLAAALVHDPEVLILDEPTTGLDPNQIVEIREVIRTLGTNKTVLFSSHILQEVEALCSRVIIIHKGRIVADNTLEQLRGQGEGHQVRVQFAEALEAEWLRRLPGVSRADSQDRKTWVLTTTDAEQLRRQVLELALLHTLNIVSLHTEHRNLEAVFRNLTAGAGQPAAD